jgi:hypothetical protein
LGLDADKIDSFGDSLDESIDELQEYGKVLNQRINQEEGLFKTLAAQAITLIDLTKYTKQEQ